MDDTILKTKKTYPESPYYECPHCHYHFRANIRPNRCPKCNVPFIKFVKYGFVIDWHTGVRTLCQRMKPIAINELNDEE